MDLIIHTKTRYLLPVFTKQTLRIMRLTVILLLAACIQVSAKEGSAQITLSEHNTPFSRVIEKIKMQSGYDFVSTYETLKEAGDVTVNVRNVTLQKALDECLKNKPLSYLIINKTVVIKSRYEKLASNSIEEAPSDPTSKLMPGILGGFSGINADVPKLTLPPLEIKGRVTDESGNPLVGVSVSLRGNPSIGTTTDGDGNYALSLNNGTGTLTFSFVGYNSLDVAVNNQSEINVSLQLLVSSMEQVVVVGYGTVKRESVVGSVGVASNKDIGDVVSSNTSQLLQGKIAGVQIVNAGGNPGGDVNIVIRGTGSFTDVSPLYVIDGIQSDKSVFNSISPNDIQDITVLKDASSVAIYGAQGANGVVIVTTRHPKNGIPRVTYNGYIGISRPWKLFDMMNAEQYTNFTKDWYETDGLPLPPRVATPYALVTRTDWQKEIFQTGKLNSQFVNVGGGSDKMSYSFSLGYQNQQGVIIGADYKRLNSRISLEEKLGKRIKLGQQLNTWYTVRTGQPANILSGLRMPPYLPVLDSTNQLGGYAIATSALDGNDASNPLVAVNLHDIKNRFLGNYFQLFGEVNILKGLTFRSQFGGRFGFSYSSDFNSTYAANQLVTPNQIGVSYNYGLGYVFENYFSYNNSWGKHNLGLTLGNSYRDGGEANNVSLIGSQFPNDEIHQIGVAKVQSVGQSGANSQARFISYFARINYMFDRKYILTLTGRQDATSLFSEANRVGYFPAIGLGWVMSKESFMSSWEFLNELKIRGSVGKTGNSNITGFSYESNVWTGGANSVVYPLGPSKPLVNGATVAIPATPNLKWETTVQTNIGIDATLFNNRLSVTLEYYKRDNRDLLVNVPVALSTGYGGVSGASSSQLINAASAINKGFEWDFGYHGKSNELKYDISFNGAYNQNKVTSLGTQGAVPIVSGSFYGVSSMTRTENDNPIGAFYGYVYDHVAIDQADVDKYNRLAVQATGDPNAEYQSGLLPGDRIFKDLDGDGQVTDADKQFIGSPIPKWTYGGNINISYKQFDFMASLEGVGGVQIINALKFYTEGEPLPFNGKTTVVNRWKNPGDITDIARAGQHFSTSTNLRPSSWFVENGDYLRFRNVTVGYTIPTERLKSFTNDIVSSFRVYITAQNLFTFTKYSGYDPEIGTGDFIFSRGIDLGATPQARSWLIGLQVGF